MTRLATPPAAMVFVEEDTLLAATLADGRSRLLQVDIVSGAEVDQGVGGFAEEGINDSDVPAGGADATALVAVTDRFVRFGRRATVLQRSADGFEAVATTDTSGAPRDTAVFGQRVFATDGRMIERRRLTDRGLTARRTVFEALEIGGLAASPRGYLVVLHRPAADADWSLGFFSPRTPRLTGARLPVVGVGEPLALSYAGRDGDRLMLLRNDGLWRIDTALDASGRQRAVGVAVAPFEAPTTMAVSPVGAVAVGEASGAIRLLDPEAIDGEPAR
ncbi:MAG: hypothetical protein AAFV43_08220 [Planctomycetota bacterium]